MKQRIHLYDCNFMESDPKVFAQGLFYFCITFPKSIRPNQAFQLLDVRAWTHLHLPNRCQHCNASSTDICSIPYETLYEIGLLSIVVVTTDWQLLGPPILNFPHHKQRRSGRSNERYWSDSVCAGKEGNVYLCVCMAGSGKWNYDLLLAHEKRSSWDTDCQIGCSALFHLISINSHYDPACSKRRFCQRDLKCNCWWWRISDCLVARKSMNDPRRAKAQWQETEGWWAAWNLQPYTKILYNLWAKIWSSRWCKY